MVNQNLWRAALLGLGFTVSSGAYAQDKIGETLIPDTSSIVDCPTCPPNVPVNTQPAPTEEPKPKKDKPAGKNDCGTLWGGKGKCMSYKDARKSDLRIYKEGHCSGNIRCYRTTVSVPVVDGGSDCTTLFEGNGRCISHSEAKSGGFTTFERGHCPGKDFCYDTTKPAEEKKVEPSSLERKVEEEQPLLGPINPEYFRPFSGCDAENTRKNGLLAQYEENRGSCEAARRRVIDYKADTVPAPAEGTPKSEGDKTSVQSQDAVMQALTSGPEPSKPTEAPGETPNEQKDVYNADTARILEEQATKLCAEMDASEQVLKGHIAFVNENGCNYKEPAAPKAERGMEFNVAARGTYDGALGAELDAAVLLPVGDKGHIGIYGNGTVPGTGVDTTTTTPETDLGDGLKQTETRKVDSSRIAGLGAQLGYDFTSWLRGYLRGGAALTEEKVHRVIDILGDQKTVDGKDKPVRLEGALGVQLGGENVYVPLEFRYNDTTGPTGATGIGVRY